MSGRARKPVCACIIGLGKVGAGYAPDSKGQPRSHLDAIIQSAGIEPVLLVDKSSSILNGVLSRYGELDPSIFVTKVPLRRKISKSNAIDVVVVCTPLLGRYDLIENLTKLRPKVLILEKPIAANCVEAKKILELCKELEIECRVNFPRRLDVRIRKIKDSLAKDPLKVIFRYSSSFENFGPHLIDFALNFFGEIKSVTSFRESVSSAGKTYDFLIENSWGLPIYCIGTGDTAYQQLDCEVFYKDRKFDFKNGMTEIVENVSVKNLVYSGVSHLEPNFRFCREPVGGLQELYQSIVKYIDARHMILGCNMEEGVMGQRVMDAIIKSSQAGFKKITLN